MDFETIDLTSVSPTHKRYIESILKTYGYLSILDFDVTQDTLAIYNEDILKNNKIRRELLWILLK